jgi:hypothetical protein
MCALRLKINTPNPWRNKDRIRRRLICDNYSRSDLTHSESRSASQQLLGRLYAFVEAQCLFTADVPSTTYKKRNSPHSLRSLDNICESSVHRTASFLLEKRKTKGVFCVECVSYALARPLLLLHPPSRAKNVKSLHNLMMMETLQKQQQQQTLGPLIAPVACANLINSRRQYQFQDQRTRRNYGSEREAR